MDQSPLPASSAVAAGDAPSLVRLLEILDRLRILLERALAPTPAGIFSDYLKPAELAAKFGIGEDQLFEWKCNGLGPPRTRIRQLVIYRRKGGSPRGGAGQTSQLLRCGRSFSCLKHNVGGRVFYYLGELDTFIRSGDRTGSSWRRRRRRGPAAPGRNYDIGAQRPGRRGASRPPGPNPPCAR